MKKLLSIVLLLFIFSSIGAQDLNNNQIGFVFTPGINRCYKFQDSFHEDTDFEGKHGFTVGLKYLRVINTNLWVETGLHYSEVRVYLTPAVELPLRDYPRTERRDMLTLPINFILKNKAGFFITGGPQIDYEVNTWTRLTVNDQSGLGFNLGIGKYFHIAENIYISIAPSIKAHALVPFNKVDNHQRLFEYGIKIDINYGFLQ